VSGFEQFIDLERLVRNSYIEGCADGSSNPGQEFWEKSDAKMALVQFIAADSTEVKRLSDVIMRVIKWVEMLAEASETRAKDTRFITLSEANAADARNYRATASDLRRELDGKR
jgi:hypothetical protein